MIEWFLIVSVVASHPSPFLNGVPELFPSRAACESRLTEWRTQIPSRWGPAFKNWAKEYRCVAVADVAHEQQRQRKNVK